MTQRTPEEIARELLGHYDRPSESQIAEAIREGMASRATPAAARPMNGSKRDPDSVVGFMCRIDFECELGSASGGNSVFPSVSDLRRCHQMADECGIVMVEVRAVEIVVEGRGP